MTDFGRPPAGGWAAERNASGRRVEALPQLRAGHWSTALTESSARQSLHDMRRAPTERIAMARTITVEHNGTSYSGKVARITSTALGWEDHGILTAYIMCEGDGWGIGVGGYCLDVTTGAPEYGRRGTAYGLDHVMRLIETVGARKWEDLKGREVLVLFPDGSDGWGGTAVGVAHISDEGRVMILAEHAEAWKSAEAVAS